jgi:hypothetical protein
MVRRGGGDRFVLYWGVGVRVEHQQQHDGRDGSGHTQHPEYDKHCSRRWSADDR